MAPTYGMMINPQLFHKSLEVSLRWCFFFTRLITYNCQVQSMHRVCWCELPLIGWLYADLCLTIPMPLMVQSLPELFILILIKLKLNRKVDFHLMFQISLQYSLRLSRVLRLIWSFGYSCGPAQYASLFHSTVVCSGTSSTFSSTRPCTWMFLSIAQGMGCYGVAIISTWQWFLRTSLQCCG